MWGIILTSIGTFFEEISSLLGKAKVAAREQSIYSMGFLHALGTLLLFGLFIIIDPGQFRFNAASLPTFGIRAVLEIMQAHFTMIAITKADRSSYGFLRTGTIPLLLLVDIALGYVISIKQIGGIILIIAALIIIFVNRGINKKGLGPIIFTTINAVATLSLYKYNITNFNSIPAEQFFILLILIFYFIIASILIAKENPFAAIRKPPLLMQALVHGTAGAVDSFAYVFAPASIIIAARRSFSVFWSILSGNLYFHEKKLALKIGAVIIVAVGIFLLI